MQAAGQALCLDDFGALPTLPAVAIEVLALCRRDDVAVTELADVVQRDPALATKVLRTINSAAYRRGGEVTSLERAAMLLGRRALQVLALGFSVDGNFPKVSHGGGIDHAELWRRSVMTALIGRAVASANRSELGEEAFLAGLLANIGKLLLARDRSEEYAHAVDLAGGWPAPRDERVVFGYSASELTGQLLAHWGIPSIICDGAAYIDRVAELPDTTDPRHRTLVTSVALAAGATIEHLGGDADAFPRLFDRAKAAFGTAPAALEEAIQGLDQEFERVAAMLEIELPAASSTSALLDQAREETVRISLEAVMDLQNTEQLAADLAVEANTDALTGLANRRSFDDFIAEQVRRRQQTTVESSLGLLLLDLDRFKTVNDTYGHHIGDAVLRQVASSTQSITRTGDLLCRYGGEEFALVLPSCDLAGLRVAAERFRRTIESLVIVLDPTNAITVTVSVGGTCATQVDDVLQLVAEADALLYRAKENGRNRCEVAPLRVD
jgi:diguanylate cyclase (GGDEF)-like protein